MRLSTSVWRQHFIRGLALLLLLPLSGAALNEHSSPPRTSFPLAVASVAGSPREVATILSRHLASPLAEEPLIIRGGVGHWVRHWEVNHAHSGGGDTMAWAGPILGEQVVVSDPVETALFGPSSNKHLFAESVPLGSALRDNSFVFGATTKLRSKLLPPSLWQSLFVPGDKGAGLATKFGEMEVVSIGGAGQGLPYHTHGAAILGLVQGLKHWALVAPEHMTEAAFREALIASPARAAATSLTDSGDVPAVFRCTQRPGDIIFLPSYWWHATANGGGGRDMTIGFGGQVAFSGDWDPKVPLSLARSLAHSQSRMRRKDQQSRENTIHDYIAQRQEVHSSAVAPPSLPLRGLDDAATPHIFRIVLARIALENASQEEYTPTVTAALSDLLSAWTAMPSFLPPFVWFFVQCFERMDQHGGSGLELAVLLRNAAAHIKGLASRSASSKRLAAILLIKLGEMASRGQGKGRAMYSEGLDILTNALELCGYPDNARTEGMDQREDVGDKEASHRLPKPPGPPAGQEGICRAACVASAFHNSAYCLLMMHSVQGGVGAGWQDGSRATTGHHRDEERDGGWMEEVRRRLWKAIDAGHRVKGVYHGSSESLAALRGLRLPLPPPLPSGVSESVEQKIEL